MPHPLEPLLGLHALLAGGAGFDTVADEAVGRVGDLLGGAAALWRTSEQSVVLAAHAHPVPALHAEMRDLVGDGVRGPHRFVRLVTAQEGQVRLTGSQVLESASLMEPAYRTFFEAHPPEEMLLQPLRWSGRTTGVLGVSRDAGAEAFTEEDRTLLAAVSQVLAVALHTGALAAEQEQLLSAARAAEQQATWLARTDVLTGLPNRSGFLREAEAGPPPAALLVLDLRRFSEVNDSLGWPAGDAVLLGVAQRLAEAAPPDAVLGRLGGDEFVVLLHGSAADAVRTAEELVAATTSTVAVLDVDVAVRARAGLAAAGPGTVDVHRLLRQATVALSRGRRSGEAVVVFDAPRDAPALSRLRDAARLREGLRDRELVVHYQRVHRLSPEQPGDPFSCEALVRWQRDGVLVPPDAFLPLVRDTGALPQLTRLVVEQVVEQALRWRALGHAPCVAVNVPASVLVGGFVEETLQLLEQHGLPSWTVCVEVLEGELVDAAARRAVARCRQAGLRVSIDDFGTGFSALGHVLDTPVDALKLDRSLVTGLAHDAGRRALVTHCTAFASEIGLQVVAEGVETEDDLVALRHAGVDWVQGYHLHRPSPADEVPLGLPLPRRPRATEAGVET